MQSRSRFSHRHLLALCTFLVPLGVLATLGQSELQRSGAETQAALERAGRQFVASARQAIEQRFEQLLPPLLAESEQLVAETGPLRTALALRQQERFAALRDVLVLDERVDIIAPETGPASLGLPFSRDARQRVDNATTAALDAADLLLSHGKRREAIDLLSCLVTQIETAKPPTGRRPDFELLEASAHFRLATAHRALGDMEQARAAFENVQRIAHPNLGRTYLEQSFRTVDLLADTGLAELGAAADRMRLLKQIAEGEYPAVADGLQSAIAHRLAATVPAESSLRPDVERLLREDHQRAATRAFAPDYEFPLKWLLRLQRRRANPDATVEPRVEHVVSALSGPGSLLVVRPATAAEKNVRKRAAYVALHLDLVQVLAPVLSTFDGHDNTFVLAVTDASDVPIVAAPKHVPDDYTPPMLETNGLTLRAFPADANQLAAETEAAVWTRTLLLLALFGTALGGALWSWRSVSREAELAALKIDLVSRVSHELKTPLALIRMYGETLGMGRARDSRQAADFGGIIARESERLTTLIQRILDFSRQQAGTLSYAPELVDVQALLRSVCDAYTPHLESRGAILVETLRPGLFARCDANAFESAVVNLLENAAKYGAEGDTEHEIELDLAAEGDTVVVEVRDRGRGIPAAERHRVFEGFYRASNAGEVRGAGLGLSLVRHFARAHGGDVTAASREGGGTVMRLVLPRAPDPSPAPSPHADAGASPAGATASSPRP